MSDWIGTPKPVRSSAPPWPRDWRIWWDPRAPHGTGSPAVPPTLNPVPPQTPDIPPQFAGTGCAGGQVQLEIEPGGYDVWFMTDASGNWTWSPVEPLPEGDYCVRVRQRCPETADSDSSLWSEWTDTECFTVAEVPVLVQTIDFEANDLRYDSPAGWPVRGVLRYNINGEWVMGVLRHVSDPYS